MIEAGAKQVSGRAVIAAVCAYYEIRRVDLVSQRREKEIVRPRQIAMWLARRLTGLSLPAIGRILGGRDHTTVLHGVRVIERLAETDIRTARDVEIIAATVGAVVDRNVVDPSIAVDVDPLQTALAIAAHPTSAVTASIEEVQGIAACLVGYALRIGALRFDGDADPDPELLPVVETMIVEKETSLAPLSAAIADVRAAYGRFATARYSVSERSAMEALCKSLLGLFETHSNTIGA